MRGQGPSSHRHTCLLDLFLWMPLYYLDLCNSIDRKRIFKGIKSLNSRFYESSRCARMRTRACEIQPSSHWILETIFLQVAKSLIACKSTDLVFTNIHFKEKLFEMAETAKLAVPGCFEKKGPFFNLFYSFEKLSWLFIEKKSLCTVWPWRVLTLMN